MHAVRASPLASNAPVSETMRVLMPSAGAVQFSVSFARKRSIRALNDVGQPVPSAVAARLSANSAIGSLNSANTRSVVRPELSMRFWHAKSSGMTLSHLPKLQDPVLVSPSELAQASRPSEVNRPREQSESSLVAVMRSIPSPR